MTHDDHLRAVQAATDPTDALQGYADWLQELGDRDREEYVRQWAIYRKDPGRKAEQLRVERRLRDLRDTLGDVWADLLEGHTAAIDLATSQAFGELTGRLDSFTVISRASPDQLDFAVEIWPTTRVNDDFLAAYFETLFDAKPLKLIRLKDWQETFRFRMGEWLTVCLGSRGDLYDGEYRRWRTRSADRDVLIGEFERLVSAITNPTTVSRAKAPIVDDEKPIPRAFLFEGPHVTLALTLAVLD